MKKTMQNKLLATFALCASAALAVGFTALPETTASAATTEDVVVATAALRTPDETYGKGLRFRLTMSESFYTANGQAQYTTGVLIAPTGANEELTLINTSEVLAKAETAAWAYVEADGVYETYVHLYNIEKADYTTKVDVCAYVDYADASTDDLYSAVVTCSVADIADYAYDNDTTLTQDAKDSLKDEYLTYTLTCDKGDGSVATTADVVYGEKLDLEEPTRANYTFDGWYNEAGTAKWDMDSNTVKGNVRLFAKWTVKEKVTLIDAATESALFSHTHVVESDSTKGQMNLGNGAGYDSTYTTVTDATHGYAIETSAKGYFLGWANFNTGITEDLKTYWTNKLDGMDKVVFYVYNGTTNPHQVRFNTADQGTSTAWVTLAGNTWTMVTVEKTSFLNLFANIAAQGNPYIAYNFKNSDGSSMGNFGGQLIKFSSFYGYTNAAYEKEFLKTVTLIDAATESALFSHTHVAESDASKGQMNLGNGAGYDSTYTTVTDATHSYAIETSAKGWVLGWANFNTDITEDLYTYWSNKLEGVDKVVFYVYNSTANPHKIRFNTASQTTSTSFVTLTANDWTMITIEKADFLKLFANISAEGNPYICYKFCNADGSDMPNTGGVTIKFSSFVGYSNLAYDQEFGA